MATIKERNDRAIAKLHPAIRTMAQSFLDRTAKEGIELLITEGCRSFERQTELYNQPHDGKDNDGDGKMDEPDEKVTNAKAGESFHNYSLAIDVVPIEAGKANWNSKQWKRIGELGEFCGFTWGGRWGHPDGPHFEFPRNTKYTTLLKLKEEGKIDKDGYIILP